MQQCKGYDLSSIYHCCLNVLLYAASHDISSMWRAYGHRDCHGRLQQHLSLGSNDFVPPEINTWARHRAPEHTGDIVFPQP